MCTIHNSQFRLCAASGPKTSIGRCAYYAYQMKAMNSGSVVSNYKYPFVYDDESKRCFVLAVSLQKLTGSRYVTTNILEPSFRGQFHLADTSVSTTNRRVQAFVTVSPGIVLSKRTAGTRGIASCR